jgi:D-alanine-D-alanine ligase
MDIGIAFDLKSDFQVSPDAPADRLAEYDSPATIQGISDALRQLGHSPRPMGGGRRLFEGLMKDPPQLLFNIAEGWGGRCREAHVPAMAEMLGIPCTHSDPLTQALTLDKAMAKRIVQSAGVPTAPFVLVTSEEEAAGATHASPLHDFPLPAIAKPAWEGSSMGIRKSSRATSLATLRSQALHLLRTYSQPILVERFLPGREITVTLLGQDPPRVLGILEIEPLKVPDAEFVYSRELKVDWSEEVAYHCPPRLEAARIRRIEEVAAAAYQALGCRDIGRIDLRFDEHGEPSFIEANALPGIAPGYSDSCILAEKAGMSYVELIDSIVRSACRRYRLQS